MATLSVIVLKECCSRDEQSWVFSTFLSPLQNVLMTGKEEKSDVLVRIYKCGLCADTFSEPGELESHVAQHQTGSGNKTFSSKHSLKVRTVGVKEVVCVCCVCVVISGGYTQNVADRNNF